MLSLIITRIKRVSESSEVSQPPTSSKDQIILLTAVQPRGLVNLINDAPPRARLVSGSIAVAQESRETSDDISVFR